MDAPRVLISRQRIAQRVEELGRQVTRDLAPALADDPTQRIVLMPILTGALIFTADLVRHIPHQMNIRCVTISSYPGTATSSQGAKLATLVADFGRPALDPQGPAQSSLGDFIAPSTVS